MKPMVCKQIIFSGHALQKMFAREIDEQQVKNVIDTGEIIKEYTDDKPHPSYLMLGIITNKPLHVVLAKETETGNCIIVTAYYPNIEIWNIDFKTKK